MIDIVDKSKCSGCYSCENICPKGCIEMKSDDEGFWYPFVNKDICIECGLCENVCPTLNDIKKDIMKNKCYGCKNRNYETRIESSSGGAFTALCEKIIESRGVVFGAIFTADMEVKHDYAESLIECKKFRGSKYVQSKIGKTYVKAEQFLKDGRLVLFSGTQCQIKGLNLFLRNKYINLITVEIICHGVPSPFVLKKYKDKKETIFKSKLKNIEFRNKTYGWEDFSTALEFENEKRIIERIDENLYMKGFLRNLYLRPSCYKCSSKNFRSGSDISLADYWGVKEKHPEFYDDKGVSLVLLNSKKGEQLFNDISMDLDIVETELEYAIEHNPCIIKPTKYNEKRKRFFKDLNKSDIELVILDNLKITLVEKIKNKVNFELSKFN